MRRLSKPLAFARTVKQLGIDNRDSLRLAYMLVSETVRRQNFIDKFINNVIRPATIDEYIAIQQWDGKLPYFLGAETVPFIQIPTNSTGSP